MEEIEVNGDSQRKDVDGGEVEGDVDREHSRSRDREKGRDKSKDREKEKERERDKDRHRDRHRDKDRERHRDRDKERESRHESRRGRDRDKEYDDHKERSRKRRRSRSKSPERRVITSRPPSKLWDKAPAGFESITPLQYKTLTAAGQIMNHLNPPSNSDHPPYPVEPIIKPPNHGIPVSLSAIDTNLALTNPNHPVNKQARKLYVGNIPFGITEYELCEFFNASLIQAKLTTNPGPPISSVQLNHEKNFAFLEFRSIDETTNALAFDGIVWRNQSLKLRRPKDYQVIPGHSSQPPSVYVPGVVSTMVADTPEKLFIGGLPNYLTGDQVKELLTPFGPLKSFNLVKDIGNGVSKGFAFCEYLDSLTTDQAIAGLNGMQLLDKNLVVQRASVGAKSSAPAPASNEAAAFITDGLPLIALANAGELKPTRILVLLNMVTPQELEDADEYLDICEDVKDECDKFGKVISIHIPKPAPKDAELAEPVRGLGKIFVEYDTLEEASAAQKALSGRNFANRTVVSTFLDETSYYNREF